MKSIEIFKNEQFGEVRVIDVDGSGWIVGKDAAVVLGYSNTNKAVAMHVDEDDRAVIPIWDGSQNRNMMVINESGLYSLTLGSKLPSAKAFKRWLTAEVLPSIRKRGLYATANTVESILSNPDFAIQLLQKYKKERQEKEQLQKKALEDRPKTLFADSVTASNTTILIGDLAKLLNQNGIDIGQKRLFEWLRNNGYLMKTGISRNMPTQKAADLGLFFVRETYITKPDGSIRLAKTTKVTGKGQVYFISKFQTGLLN